MISQRSDRVAVVTDDATEADFGGPKNHRTIDRVTQILEEVVYHPGIGFAELARVLDAPKSSVHGFIRGLQAKGRIAGGARCQSDQHGQAGDSCNVLAFQTLSLVVCPQA